MISEEKIKQAVQRLVEVASPIAIFLFGSYVRGDAKECSDLDFLIVEHKVTHRRREMVRLHDAIRPMRITVDILVISESTFNKWCEVSGTVIHKASTEGRLCCDISEAGRKVSA